MFIRRLRCSLGGVKRHIRLLLMGNTVEPVPHTGVTWCFSDSELSSNSGSVTGTKKSVRFAAHVRDFSFALCDHGKVDSVCLHRSKTVGQSLEY